MSKLGTKFFLFQSAISIRIDLHYYLPKAKVQSLVHLDHSSEVSYMGTIQESETNMNSSTQTDRSVSPQSDKPAVKVGILPLFSSWVYRCENGPIHLNAQLEALAHQLMEDDHNATKRT